MECPRIPTVTLGEFGRRLHEKIVARRIPADGSMEVTARCNLHCKHCYINLPANDSHARRSELSRGELFNLIDQIVDEGCLWLLFTGGEPFVRSDFLDVYAHAKKKGLLITLFTNGTIVTPRIADYLAELRPFAIEITVYGRTRETYERVTNVSGSYDRCMHAIELLLERKLPLRLKTMILTLNKHEVRDMKQFAEGLGVEFRFDPLLNLRLDGVRAPADFRISPEEVVALDIGDAKRMKQWNEFCATFWGPPQNPEYLYQCGAAQGTFHIDPYGHLSACMMARDPSFDLRKGKFGEGWRDFMSTVLKQRWKEETACKRCELFSLCGQCPGFAQIENKDQEKRVEYLCAIAHLRAESFGLRK